MHTSIHVVQVAFHVLIKMARYTKKIFIWIPREDPIYRSVYIDGTDMSSYLRYSKFTQAINTEVGSFEIQIANPSGKFSEDYVGNEDVDVYMSTSEAFSLKFKGFIQKVLPKVLNGRNVLSITGLHIAGKLMDPLVNVSYTATAISTILKELITDYASNFTTTNVADCEITATINWVNKSLWDCIIDLIKLSGFDFYVDNEYDLHFFESGSVENIDEAIVLSNFSNMEYFGTDISEVRNKISYLGQTDEGLPIVYTEQDSTSISDFGQKEKIIPNTKANTSTEVEEKAAAQLSLSKDSITRGKFITNQLLVTIKPGDLIWVSIPPQKIHGQYVVHKYTHESPNNRTIVQFKQEQTVSSLFKERTDTEQRIDSIKTTGGLGFSWAFPFDDDSQVASHSGTRTNEGALKVESGQTSGTMISIVKNSSFTINKVMLKISGSDLDNVFVTISATDGVYWVDGSLNTGAAKDVIYEAPDTIPIPWDTSLLYAGNKLKVRVHLHSAAAKVDSLVILYDT